MKLYHIDRSGHIKSGETISLIKNFPTKKMKDKEYYKDGLSSHGLCYYTYDARDNNFLIDVVFEYERLLHYPDKLSRYQAFFCFDGYGVIEFVKTKYLEDNFYKIYEIDVDPKKVERHNMSLVRGWSHQSALKYARLYFEDKPNIYDKDDKIIYEYLVKLPVVIGKEIKLSQIEKIVKQKEKSNKKINSK